MESKTNNGVLGVVLLGVGAGIAAAGAVLLTPICASWSRKQLTAAYSKGKDGLLAGFELATTKLTEVASRAEHPLGRAAAAAKQTTGIAAGAIESAAHYVREQVSEAKVN